MLKNYFKTAFRNLLRNKSYAFINITGLAVGVAACLLIFLVIQYETSFDTFHKNKERIYRVGTLLAGSGEGYTPGIVFPAAAQLRLDYPQLQNVASINAAQGMQITVMDENGRPTQKKFSEDGLFFAEPQFFEIFNFPYLAGDPKTALAEPFTAVITQKTAERYFGDWHKAVGRAIKYGANKVCRITGVLQNLPGNTDFPIDIAISFKTTENATSTDWVSTYTDLNTYVILPPNMSEAQFNKNLLSFTKKHKPAEYATNILVAQPLSTIHTDKRFGNYNNHIFSNELLMALSLIGIFLLVIACINFINLATAQAVNRAKEVGVRKVLGSRKKQLIAQFLSETFIITFSAVIIAILIAITILPLLNTLLSTKATMQFNGTLLLFLSALVVVVTFLSGFYPAIVLSGFNPITALKSKFTSKTVGGISLRRGLVVLQFVIAQALIMGTLVVVSQMNYFRTTSMGFDKDAIVAVGVPGDSASLTKIDALKAQLLQQSGVKEVNFSLFTIADNGHWNSDFVFNGSGKKTDFAADLRWADANVFKTYGLQILAGRAYLPSDTVREFVVNETLVKMLGFKNPQDVIGKKMNFWGGQINAPIVGVVKDFNTSSLAKPMLPVALAPYKDMYRTVGIKIQSKDAKQTLAAIEKVWNAFYPEYIYNHIFLDEKIERFYQQEDQLAQLYKLFAGIAIFISCLGLYGLISFMAIQRTKEVGIRKVLGASVGSIVYLFSKEFTLLIGIAFLIAAPLSYYFMHQWLENFTYKISISGSLFILTILASVIIAWITVGYRALRAAHANPVRSLRTE